MNAYIYVFAYVYMYICNNMSPTEGTRTAQLVWRCRRRCAAGTYPTRAGWFGGWFSRVDISSSSTCECEPDSCGKRDYRFNM